MSYKNYYTIYDRKTETVVAFGTSKECTQMLKCSSSYFYCLVNRNRNGRNKKYLIESELLTDEDY